MTTGEYLRQLSPSARLFFEEELFGVRHEDTQCRAPKFNGTAVRMDPAGAHIGTPSEARMVLNYGPLERPQGIGRYLEEHLGELPPHLRISEQELHQGYGRTPMEGVYHKRQHNY